MYIHLFRDLMFLWFVEDGRIVYWILQQLGSIKYKERKLTSLDLTRNMPRLNWYSVSLHQHLSKYQTLLTQRPLRLLLTSNNQRLWSRYCNSSAA